MGYLQSGDTPFLQRAAELGSVWRDTPGIVGHARGGEDVFLNEVLPIFFL
jgi:hypothetical protein